MSETRHLVVMGVSGSGKTTVAKLLAERLHRPFAEADDFHPRANIDKMAAGHALTDADRQPWLRRLRDWLSAQTDAGHSTVVTCSALRRRYRDLLRQARGRLFFVHLSGSPDLIAERLRRRGGHFMPPALLPSQFDALEPLAPDEAGLTIDIGPTAEDLARRILAEPGPTPRLPD